MTNTSKKAKTDYPITELASNRWSPRAFADIKIETEKIYAVLEAARWSPSAFNEQPWRFIIGIKNDGNKIYEKIFDALVEFNKNWARFAPVLLVCLAKKNFSHNNKPNNTAAYDLGQAAAHLTYQAMAEGLFVHQMSGFDKNKLQNEFNVSTEFEIFSIIALGYIGSPEILPDDLKEAELKTRERKTVNQIIFDNNRDL